MTHQYHLVSSFGSFLKLSAIVCSKLFSPSISFPFHPTLGLPFPWPHSPLPQSLLSIEVILVHPQEQTKQDPTVPRLVCPVPGGCHHRSSMGQPAAYLVKTLELWLFRAFPPWPEREKNKSSLQDPLHLSA